MKTMRWLVTGLWLVALGCGPADDLTAQGERALTAPLPPLLPPPGTLPQCGNGVLEPGEQCETTKDWLKTFSVTCTDIGYSGGMLGCNSDCTYNTSACSVCGDGVKSVFEVCEGSDLGGRTCASEGFDGGTLACSDQCQLDTDQCHRCGDGVVGGPEECDGANLNGATCQSQGFDTGTLSCSASCTLDRSGCTACHERAYYWKSSGLQAFDVSDPNSFVSIGGTGWGWDEQLAFWADDSDPTVGYGVFRYGSTCRLDVLDLTDPKSVKVLHSTSLPKCGTYHKPGSRFWLINRFQGYGPYIAWIFRLDGGAAPVYEGFRFIAYGYDTDRFVAHGDTLAMYKTDKTHVYDTNDGTTLQLVGTYAGGRGGSTYHNQFFRVFEVNNHAVLVHSGVYFRIYLRVVSLADGKLVHSKFWSIGGTYDNDLSPAWLADDRLYLGNGYSASAIDLSVPAQPVVEVFPGMPLYVSLSGSRAVVSAGSATFSNQYLHDGAPPFAKVPGLWPLQAPNRIDLAGGYSGARAAVVKGCVSGS